MRNLSMKKFGTPILAAPGAASVYVGSAGEGGVTFVSSTGGGVGVASGTLPVSDFVLGAASSACWAGRGPTRVTLSRADPVFPAPGGVATPGDALGAGEAVAAWVAVGGCVTVGVTVGVFVAVGSGVLSADPRSTIEATAAGRPAIWTWSTGVPDGTSTVIVSCCPVTSVTRT